MQISKFGIPILRSCDATFLLGFMALDDVRSDIKVWDHVRSLIPPTLGNFTYGLPEGKEDNELDRQDFQKRGVSRDIEMNLEVELDQTVHCSRDRDGFNN
jgi:hypothetical protein